MNNPLQKYMRSEEMYLKLPSLGKYYDEGDIDLTELKEVGIMPMTAKDEISLNTPDALLNGEGIKKAVKSCVPAIRNPESILMPDFDALLLAIKKVSYGDSIHLPSVCPNCEHQNEFRISVDGLLSTMRYAENEYTVSLTKDLTVFLRPSSFRITNIMAITAFETSKIIKSLEDVGDNEDLILEKLKNDYDESVNKLAYLAVELLLDSIHYVKIPGSDPITDRDMLREWVSDLDSKHVKSLQSKVDEISKSIGVDPKIPVKCEECEHEYIAELEFNPTDFFETGS